MIKNTRCTSQIQNCKRCLNCCERVVLVKKGLKVVSSYPLISCAQSVPVKEKPRKKKCFHVMAPHRLKQVTQFCLTSYAILILQLDKNISWRRNVLNVIPIKHMILLKCKQFGSEKHVEIILINNIHIFKFILDLL